MNHLALFNGIGGFQLAAHWAGWNNVAHCEIDDKCNQVVKKHFPKSICHTDIKQFNAKEYAGTIDIISGGFPCQPFSVAGNRKGKDDNRFLWPEMLRIIKEVQPKYIVGENVAGITSMENGQTLLRILTDLENAGYNTQQVIIPACSVGAWHRRDRIWIMAIANTGYSGPKRRIEEINEGGSKSWIEPAPCNLQSGEIQENVSNSNNERLQRSQEAGNISQIGKERNKQLAGCSGRREYWEDEPNVGRVANGVSGRVDRLKQLGNAIVPQVAYEIFRAIALYNENSDC